MTTAPAARSRRTTSASRVAAGPWRAAAVSRHLAGDVDIVFDRDRHAQQRQPFTGVEAALRGGRLFARGVSQHHAVGPQLRIQAGNPFQIDLEQRRCGDLTGASIRACSAAPAKARSRASTAAA